MSRKRKMLSQNWWLVAAVMLGVAVTLLVSTQAVEPNKTAAPAEKMPKCTVEDMHKCTNMCIEKCQTNMKDVAEAKTAVRAAIEAIDKGDAKAAKGELEKAESLLATVHKSMEENIAKMPCVNDRCPITGKAIDIMNRPKDCTRMYKGMKVGFCCPNCPPEWDKLTDAEKDAKLKAVMPSKEVKKEVKMSIY
jgi:soluble cytochrome b562